MKNKNFLTVAMLCCSTLVAFGQFDLTTNNFIEAEDWVSELNCHVNDMEGKTIKSNEGFSNKKSVQFMSGGVEYVTTYVINGIPKAGTYNLNLYMGQMKARAMQIGVNHQEYQRLSFVSEVDLSPHQIKRWMHSTLSAIAKSTSRPTAASSKTTSLFSSPSAMCCATA